MAPQATHRYSATVSWKRNGARFTDGRYSRAHVWRFDAGIEVPASAALASVPAPYATPDAVDPEEAFVAALASCHMLFFLSFAAESGIVVDVYQDAAVGVMTQDAQGKSFISKVTLQPAVAFSIASLPTRDEIAELHRRAHEECYIANSIRSEVVIEPRAALSS